MNNLNEANRARLSLVAAFCEDMVDVGGDSEKAVYEALSEYLCRRWRPLADAFAVDEK